MTGLRYDMSQFYPLKAALEQVLGRRTYQKLKETGTIADWKVETKKLLKAIDVSVRATVKVADAEFFEEVTELVELGSSQIQSAKEISDLLASLSATLTRLVFLQIGYLPSRHAVDSVPLVPRNWTLDPVRSVQYVQSSAQKETAKRLSERRNAASRRSAP